jgi:hypothetical protein
MHWEALSALASLASTGIVLGAAITALRHMRLANQINAFDEIMAWQQSTEALEGRRFLENGRTGRKVPKHYPATFVRSANLSDVFSVFGPDE